MKKIKNSEENKKILHCFLLFYTVFKTMKKINNFFTGFLSAVVAAGHLLSRTSGNQINHVVSSSGGW
jgi:hypothetical protein